MAISVLPEIFKRLKRDLPKFSPEEIAQILECLNGIRLPPAPYRYLPETISNEVFEGMIQDIGGEPLRREIEDGETDAEYWEYFRATPPGRLVSRLRAMSPEEILALVCTVYFWWTARRLQELRSRITDEMPLPNYEDFFGSMG
jgi:hypothetical protein